MKSTDFAWLLADATEKQVWMTCIVDGLPLRFFPSHLHIPCGASGEHEAEYRKVIGGAVAECKRISFDHHDAGPFRIECEIDGDKDANVIADNDDEHQGRRTIFIVPEHVGAVFESGKFNK